MVLRRHKKKEPVTLYVIGSFGILWSWRWESNPRPADYKLASLNFYPTLTTFNKHY